MKEIDKIIKSTTPPKSKDVLWDNGKELLINRNGKWENANTTEIKEGSIPLSALSDEVKRGLPYIKYNAEKQIIDIKVGVTDYKINGVLGSYFEFNNVIIPRNYGSGFNTKLTGPQINGKVVQTGEGFRLILDRSPVIDETATICPNVDVYKLDDVFLPNDVLKQKDLEESAPDWNAKPGDAGYIENRTHGTDLYNKIVINDKDISAEYTILDEINSNFVYQLQREDVGLLRKSLPTLNVPIYNVESTDWVDIQGFGPPLQVVHTQGKTYIRNPYGHVANKNITFWNEHVFQLDEVYIPNTIVKTTPQELSDTDKNQALTNLGIDPVVWKYICKPFIFSGEYPVKIPSELMEDGKLKYKIPAMYRININNNYVDSNGDPIDFTDINEQYGEYTPESVGDNTLYTMCLYNDYIVAINISSTGEWSIEVTV